MTKLPVVSGQELCKILVKLGYEIDHQTGSHIPFRRITVPNHKEVAKGTLRSVIRETGLSLDEFIKLK